jgi:hypothetical protein
MVVRDDEIGPFEDADTGSTADLDPQDLRWKGFLMKRMLGPDQVVCVPCGGRNTTIPIVGVPVRTAALILEAGSTHAPERAVSAVETAGFGTSTLPLCADSASRLNADRQAGSTEEDMEIPWRTAPSSSTRPRGARA